MRTRQLQAHYAAIQLDAVLNDVVCSYIPTLDLLVDEFHEQADAREREPGYSQAAHRSRRAALFDRYRAAVVALGEALVELRGDVGADRDDLPPGDAGTRAKLERLRRSAERHRASAVAGVSS
jgi:hypothetical protein